MRTLGPRAGATHLLRAVGLSSAMGSGPGLGRLLGSAEHPGEADHGDGETDHARDLRDAEVAEPEAVEAERFDGESADGIEADVAEEQRAGMPPEPRAEQQDDQREEGGGV